MGGMICPTMISVSRMTRVRERIPNLREGRKCARESSDRVAQVRTNQRVVNGGWCTRGSGWPSSERSECEPGEVS